MNSLNRFLLPACKMQSLTHIPPLVVSDNQVFTFFSSFEKKYDARGFSLKDPINKLDDTNWAAGLLCWNSVEACDTLKRSHKLCCRQLFQRELCNSTVTHSMNSISVRSINQTYKHMFASISVAPFPPPSWLPWCAMFIN